MPSSRKNWVFTESRSTEYNRGLCKDNNYSQSKITGLLVEEALRLRGFLGIQQMTIIVTIGILGVQVKIKNR